MIHPTSVVSNNAEIDETTNIGPFCIIGDGVKIGKNNNLISHVSIIGDTNTDGSVDILDVILVVNQILNDDYNNIGDLNSDNSLDVIDIVLLMEIILNY